MTRKSQHASLPYRVGQQLDRAIGVVAPGWAWKRAKLRLVTEAAFKLAKYQGADRGRLFGHWNPGGGSADADLLPDLATLRERSRDLNRNDAIAAGITATKVANVIGTGIRPQSRVDREQLGLEEGQADALQKAIEQAWQAWVPWADAENRQDFYELQELIHRQTLENGEVIILRQNVQPVAEPPRPRHGRRDGRLQRHVGRLGAAVERHPRLRLLPHHHHPARLHHRHVRHRPLPLVPPLQHRLLLAARHHGHRRGSGYLLREPVGAVLNEQQPR